MLDEWLIAVDTTTPFCVGARSGVGDYLRLIREFDVGCHCRRNVRPTRRFVMITSPHWLQHLHSDQRVRPIGILLREMKASLGQNVTNWSSLSETSDNARPPTRALQICRGAIGRRVPGHREMGLLALASVTPFTSMCYFRPSWFWIVRTMTNVGIARSAVRRICQEVEYRMK